MRLWRYATGEVTVTVARWEKWLYVVLVLGACVRLIEDLVGWVA